MVISEKYAIDAYLEYLIQKNNKSNVEEIFIWYEPQIDPMQRMLKRNKITYKREGNTFYL